MWEVALPFALLLLAAALLAVTLVAVGHSFARPGKRVHLTLLWLLAGATLPALPMVRLLGLGYPERESVSAYASTALGHGYYLEDRHNSGIPNRLLFPGQDYGGWQIERMGCAGRNVVLQARHETVLYGVLTPEGQFREMNDLSALGPIQWTPEDGRDLPAACRPEPKPPQTPWQRNMSHTLFLLSFPLWLGLLLFFTARWLGPRHQSS